MVCFNHPCRSNSVHFGHANVHSDNSWLEHFYSNDGFITRSCLTNDFDVWVGSQHPCEHLSHHDIIIHEQYSNSRRHDYLALSLFGILPYLFKGCRGPTSSRGRGATLSPWDCSEWGRTDFSPD